VQGKYLWRFYVLKRNSAVRFSQIETKQRYLAIVKSQLNACAFSDGVEKQKCCLGPGDIKTFITFLLNNFSIPNLAGCFVTAIGTVFVIFTFFPLLVSAFHTVFVIFTFFPTVFVIFTFFPQNATRSAVEA